MQKNPCIHLPPRRPHPSSPDSTSSRVWFLVKQRSTIMLLDFKLGGHCIEDTACVEHKLTC